jgi:hypothetical protein
MRDKSKPKRESNNGPMARVMKMVSEVEAQSAANPSYPAHVASDADKFAEIFRRLDALEKNLMRAR